MEAERGSRNPLDWLLRHCPGILWATYERLSGETIPRGPQTAGIAPRSIGDVQVDPQAPPPSEGCEEAMQNLRAARGSLKSCLVENAPVMERLDLIFERRRKR